MTDAEFESVKTRIMRFAERWTPLLGLSDWDIDWEFHRERDAQNPEIAHASVHWEYEMATIAWTVPCIIEEDHGDAKLERIVVHELMHIILKEMRDDEKRKDIAHEERVATRLSKAFIRTRDAPPDATQG